MCRLALELEKQRHSQADVHDICEWNVVHSNAYLSTWKDCCDVLSGRQQVIKQYRKEGLYHPILCPYKEKSLMLY